MDMISPRKQLDTLWQRGRDFLGTEYAILGGAMTWVSERNLVSALSNAGGFGVIACGAMTPELLDGEIVATAALTDKPFGVNLITMHPQLDELIDVCLSHNVGHIILAGGLPGAPAIKRAKDGGAKVVCFAPTLSLAKRLIRQGADALVIEGAEAGGHIGPVATSILAQEILPHIEDVPVFIAGGIGRGDAVLAYLEMERPAVSSARCSSARPNPSRTRISRRRSSGRPPAMPCRRSSSTRSFRLSRCARCRTTRHGNFSRPSARSSTRSVAARSIRPKPS